MEQLTPGGLAGVAVVRVAAHERSAVLALLRTPAGTAFSTAPGVPRRALLEIDGRALDDVLVVDRGPHGLELHLHGAPAVLEALHDRFGLAAASPRSAAERLLRDALSTQQVELAVEQLAHDFDAWCRGLAALPPAERAAATEAAVRRSRAAMALATPQRVVLAGRANAGKSSLFNALLFRERALTGPAPGLTRDPVVERTALAGYPYELVDTAGEQPDATGVAAAAIAGGRRLRDTALVLLVVDAALGPTAVDRTMSQAGPLVVASKSDLPRALWPEDMPCHAAVSVLRQDAGTVRTLIGELLRRHRELPPAGPAGGPAALCAAQWTALVGGDCPRDATPA